MSRGQSTQAFNTASGQNAQNNTNAQSAFGDTQSDINDYQQNLSKFVSGNPYTAGGEYDQTINPGLASTSDAGSASLKGALQSQALRTGQNSAADAATAASGAQQNTRDLSTAMANAQQTRIGNEANYNEQGLQASAVPAQMESSLYGTSLGGANSALGTETSAAQTPSFWDEVGNGLAGSLAKGVSVASNGTGVGVCWIAESLWDVYDPRTYLVRRWLNWEYGMTFPGNAIVGLYRLIGRQVAWLVRHSKLVRWIISPLFNKALALAQEWA